MRSHFCAPWRDGRKFKNVRPLDPLRAEVTRINLEKQRDCYGGTESAHPGSGIALAAVCAYRYGLPMVFAKKAKSDNIEGGLYQSEIFSYTYKRKVTLLVAKDWITARDRVLIIDDFLARGEAMRGLIDIVTQAGAELAGIGVAVEKGFQHGGDQLRQAGYPLKSLAILDKADKDGFTFRED